MNDPAELIRQILLEPDSDDNLLSDGSELEDHMSARSQDSGTEQDLSSDYDSEDELPLSNLQFPSQRLLEGEQSVTNLFYVGKDGTKWSKEPPVQQVRTRSENIIRQTPGVSQVAKLAQSELECWSLFFPESMLSIILIHTNLQIRERNTGCESIPHFKKEIDMPEFKAFIGLLYKAGFYEPPVRVPGVRKRCQICPYARHRKTSHVCEDCHKYICPEHTVSFCQECATTAENNSV